MAKNEVAPQTANTALAIMGDLEQDAGAGFDGMTRKTTHCLSCVC